MWIFIHKENQYFHFTNKKESWKLTPVLDIRLCWKPQDGADQASSAQIAKQGKWDWELLPSCPVVDLVHPTDF
jgi:hypothetical protein